MVTDRQQPSGVGLDGERSVVTVDVGPGTGRAQLLLIGAIVLAVVIVGLSVVANSFFVTESSASVDVSAQSDTATRFDYESRRSVESLIFRVNHRNRNLTAPELATVVDDNVTGYSRLLSESYVRSSGAAVNLTYHNESSTLGRRIVQAENGNVTRASDSTPPPGWVVVRPTDRQEIGRFVMNVDAESSEKDQLEMTVTNSSDDEVRIELNRSTNGLDLGVEVESTVDYDGGPTTTTKAFCEASDGRVLLDIEAGEALPSSCDFPGIETLDGPVDIEIENGDNLVAEYEIVTNGTVSAPTFYDSCSAGPDPPDLDDPCTAPAVWTANVTARFDGSEVQYANSMNISVYEREQR